MASASRIVLRTAKFLGIGLAAFIVCYVTWEAAAFGLFGRWLTPRGENRAKLIAIQNLMATLKAGMPAEEARAATKASFGVFPSETCPGGPKLPCDRPKSPSDYRLLTRIQGVAWTGVVIWDDFVYIDVQDGIVTSVKQERIGTGP